MARIKVTWNDGQEAGMIEDRSETGMGIRIKRPIDIGTEVHILHVRNEYIGIVRRCRREKTEFLVGIQIVHSANGS